MVKHLIWSSSCDLHREMNSCKHFISCMNWNIYYNIDKTYFFTKQWSNKIHLQVVLSANDRLFFSIKPKWDNWLSFDLRILSCQIVSVTIWHTKHVNQMTISCQIYVWLKNDVIISLKITCMYENGKAD